MEIKPQCYPSVSTVSVKNIKPQLPVVTAKETTALEK